MNKSMVSMRREGRPLRVWLVFTGALAGSIFLSACSSAPPEKIDPQAEKVLRVMSEKIGWARYFTVRGRRVIDAALTGDLGVAGLSEVSASVRRPDAFRGRLVGKRGERHFYYDGKTLTILDARRKTYATMPAPGSIDALAARLEERFGFPVPITDFIASDPYARLTARAQTLKYVGGEQIGIEYCHHLVFQGKERVWEMWVSARDNLPRRFISTATALKGKPGIEIVLDEAVRETRFPEGFFQFRPPPDAKRVDPESLERRATYE